MPEELRESYSLYELKMSRCKRTSERPMEADSPRAIAMLGYGLGLCEQLQECMYVIGLDSGNKVTAYWLVSVGTVDRCCIHMREIFRPAMMESCTALALMHNHPSGDTTPSRQDITMTEKVKEVGKLFNIKIIDHVIIGHDIDSYRSFREQGIIW